MYIIPKKIKVPRGRPRLYDFTEIDFKGVLYPQTKKEMLLPISNNKLRQAACKYAKKEGLSFMFRTARDKKGNKTGIFIIRLATYQDLVDALKDF